MTNLTDLAEAARGSGLRVRVIPGWKWRGRPRSSGAFNPIGVLCHHTGGSSDSVAYVRWMTLTGRSDLPAPLAQVSLSRRGVVYICASGRANHAGRSGGSGPIPYGDGNALLVGIEAMNTGSEGWDSVGRDAAGRKVTQRDAYARLCAALCRHYGWDADTVRAHRETSTTGKWDPGLLDMNTHRAAVAQLIANPNTLEDFDMDKTEARELFREVLRDELRNTTQDARIKDPAGDGTTYSLTRLLWTTRRILVRVERRLTRLERKINGMES